ncbi:MAG: hypothetical protein CME30_00660 [Gemmatimonadetes bacterium]|nr:hypothetical protein [Gemmatimonadota bacterium]
MSVKKKNWWEEPFDDRWEILEIPGVVEPRQARSRRTFEEILRAASELVYEFGLRGTTVQEVLVRSRVGASSFYGKFEGRDALLEYMAALFWLGARDEWGSVLDPRRWEEGGPVSIVEQVMNMLVGWFRAEEAVLKAFLLHALGEPEGRRIKRISKFDNWLADGMIALLVDGEKGVGHESPRLGVRVATLQSIATVRSRLLFVGREGEDGISDESLADEMTRGFLGHLQLVKEKES